jgi:predicted ATP-dependent endonuclease of OLD family
MSSYVKRIEADGLYGTFRLQQEFDAGVNVLYGNNGGGKTTLLHILANVLNGDYDRFAFINFKTIQIQLDDNHVFKLYRRRERDEFTYSSDVITVDYDDQTIDTFTIQEIEDQEPTLFTSSSVLKPKPKIVRLPNALLPAAYFPAFRVAIEAWKSLYPSQEIPQSVDHPSSNIEEEVTDFVRRWLLPFIPRITYPSLSEIEQMLAGKVENAWTNQSIDQYLSAINNILERKKVIVNRERGNIESPPIELVCENGLRSKGLVALSSGERQIVTMIFAATQLSSQKVVLIDEPEISLHVDWQRILLDEMSKQLPGLQIIACTHSPVIGADYSMKELVFYATRYDDMEIPL